MSSAALYSSRAYKLPEAQTWNCQCATKAEAKLLPHAECSTTRRILCQAENADLLRSLSISFGQEKTMMRNVLVSTVKASAVMLYIRFQYVTDSTFLRCMARILWGMLACQVFHQQRWERMTCRLWWHSQCSGWQHHDFFFFFFLLMKCCQPKAMWNSDFCGGKLFRQQTW